MTPRYQRRDELLSREPDAVYLVSDVVENLSRPLIGRLERIWRALETPRDEASLLKKLSTFPGAAPMELRVVRRFLGRLLVQGFIRPVRPDRFGSVPKKPGAESLSLPLLLQAQQHLGRQQLDETRRLCQEALELQPDRAAAYNMLAIAARMEERFDEAESLFRKGWDRQPDDRQCRLNLASLLAERGRPDEAEAILRQAMRDHPRDAEVYQRLARFHIGQKRPETARELSLESLALAPGALPFWLAHAELLFEAGQLPLAQRCFEKALAAPEHLPGLHRRLGDIRARQGEVEAARHHYLQALALGSRDPFVPLHHAILLIQHQRFEEATRILKQLVEKQPRFLPGHNALATIYLQTGPPARRLQYWLRHGPTLRGADRSAYPALAELQERLEGDH